jgi:hypothetical protein
MSVVCAECAATVVGGCTKRSAHIPIDVQQVRLMCNTLDKMQHIGSSATHSIFGNVLHLRHSPENDTLTAIAVIDRCYRQKKKTFSLPATTTSPPSRCQWSLKMPADASAGRNVADRELLDSLCGRDLIIFRSYVSRGVFSSSILTFSVRCIHKPTSVRTRRNLSTTAGSTCRSYGTFSTSRRQ